MAIGWGGRRTMFGPGNAIGIISEDPLGKKSLSRHGGFPRMINPIPRRTMVSTCCWISPWYTQQQLQLQQQPCSNSISQLQQHHHQPWDPSQPMSSSMWIQKRHFDARKKRKRQTIKDPFRVLGIKKGCMFKDAKQTFLKIDMKHHPDTAIAATEDEKTKMREIFIQSRMAFESIAEGPNGTACLKTDLDDEQQQDEDEMERNFDSWFKSETGYNSPFALDMDPQTMKEVAKMTDTIAGADPGLDRDGGMWALARMVTSAVKQGKEAGAILQLESGDLKDQARGIDGELRRRRRR